MLSYGGKFFILVISHFFLIPTLKEFKKSTNICQSYSKNKSGPVFLDSQCSVRCVLITENRRISWKLRWVWTSIMSEPMSGHQWTMALRQPAPAALQLDASGSNRRLECQPLFLIHDPTTLGGGLA